MNPSSETFGRYDVIRRLAFGGMAEIFLASLRRGEGFEKRVVVKRILPQYSADQDFVQMFIDEAVLAARLSHPNIVHVYDFGEVDGVYFIAMEYVDGVDLRRVLRRGDRVRRALGPAEVAAIGEQIARGLSYAHGLSDEDGRPLQIVHRDVSPHNIMLSRSGEAKLMDFGIAKAGARATRTATGMLKGKVAYMAPEQAAGGTVDKRCDQFALGLVLWECLSGERMFAGGSDLEMLRRVMACEVRPLRPLAPDVPEALEQIVMRTLAERPGDRYSDASELAAALAGFRFSLGTAGAVDLAAFVDASSGTLAASERRTLPLQGIAPEEAGATDPPPPPRPSAGAAVAPEVCLQATAVASAAVSETILQSVQPAVAGTADRPARPWLATALVVGVLAVTFAVVAVVVNRRHEGPSSRVVAAPAVAESTLEVSSTPPGARILINGRETGLVTPATIAGQMAGARVRLALVLEGYRRWEQQVRIEAGETRARAELTRPEPVERMRPSDTASGAAQATPIREPVLHGRRRGKRKQPARKPPPQPPDVAGEGTLFLRSTTVWVDVYLGDRHLGQSSLNGVRVPAGKLELRLVNEKAGVDQIVVVEVEPGRTARATVSPKAR